MASQTKERSLGPEQLSLATYLHRPWDDYSSAVQDVAKFQQDSTRAHQPLPTPLLMLLLSIPPPLTDN